MRTSPDRELLKGGIDFHAHPSPAIFPRLLDDSELANVAVDYGLRAVVIKDHDQITTGRAYYVNRMFPGVKTIGSLILNRSMGGLNPYVVEAALAYGTQVVFMPTNHSKWHQDYYGHSNYPGLVRTKPLVGEGITVLGENGKLKPEVLTILDLIAGSGVVLGTGHLHQEEVLSVVDEAVKRGVSKILVTHANWALSKLSIDVQKKLMGKGALIEYVALTMVSPYFYEQKPIELAEWIMEFKGENLVMSSDLGQVHGPPPPEGIRMALAALLQEGVPYEYLEKMTKVNPAKLLGLSL